MSRSLMLKQLTDAIQHSKVFVSYAVGLIDGYRINVSDIAYDRDTDTVFLFCDPSSENIIPVTQLFAEAHRHPVATMVLVCEELEAVFDVKDYHIECGNSSFGESNFVVLS